MKELDLQKLKEKAASGALEGEQVQHLVKKLGAYHSYWLQS
jgi:hypothetical protein